MHEVRKPVVAAPSAPPAGSCPTETASQPPAQPPEPLRSPPPFHSSPRTPAGARGGGTPSHRPWCVVRTGMWRGAGAGDMPLGHACGGGRARTRSPRDVRLRGPQKAVPWAGTGLKGLKWSGCIVRIRLWPRLPHGCHRLLSIRRRSALSQCELCPEVSPRSCSRYPCWQFGLYRVMCASRSVVTPFLCCLDCWPPFGHTWSGFNGTVG